MINKWFMSRSHCNYHINNKLWYTVLENGTWNHNVPNSNIHSKWRAIFKVYMKKLHTFMMYIQTISIIIFYHIVQIIVESLILEQAIVNDHLNWINTSKLLSFLYVYFRCCRSNRNIFMGYFFHLLLLFQHCYISLSSQILQQQYSQSIWQQPIMWRIIHDTRQHLVFHRPGKLIMINVFRSQKEKMGRKHDDVIKWKHFPCYWPFERGIHHWNYFKSPKPN